MALILNPESHPHCRTHPHPAAGQARVLGLCGEFSKFAALWLRALAPQLQLRLVLDLSDHVWLEAWLEQEWLGVDVTRP